MLTPTANFAVDPDQTVRRRAVRFGSTLFATKTSNRQRNIGNPVQAAPSSLIWVHTVCYKDGLWVVMSGKCNLCLPQPYRQTFGTQIRLLLGDLGPHLLLQKRL